MIFDCPNFHLHFTEWINGNCEVPNNRYHYQGKDYDSTADVGDAFETEEQNDNPKNSNGQKKIK